MPIPAPAASLIALASACSAAPACAAGQPWVVPVTLIATNVIDIGGRFLSVGVAYVDNVEPWQFAAQSELHLSATNVFQQPESR
jgi:hypothetical protein